MIQPELIGYIMMSFGIGILGVVTCAIINEYVKAREMKK